MCCGCPLWQSFRECVHQMPSKSQMWSWFRNIACWIVVWSVIWDRQRSQETVACGHLFYIKYGNHGEERVTISIKTPFVGRLPFHWGPPLFCLQLSLFHYIFYQANFSKAIFLFDHAYKKWGWAIVLSILQLLTVWRQMLQMALLCDAELNLLILLQRSSISNI